MFDEFLLEVFFIKIKIKGYLENITEKTIENIDTFGIKKDNTITYLSNDTKYKLTYEKNKVIMIRDNQEFTHNFIFINNIKNKSTYYIKEYSTNIEMEVLTTKLISNEKKIVINYKVLENDNNYKYTIEMR